MYNPVHVAQSSNTDAKTMFKVPIVRGIAGLGTTILGAGSIAMMAVLSNAAVLFGQRSNIHDIAVAM
jgi:hypothetical protein